VVQGKYCLARSPGLLARPGPSYLLPVRCPATFCRKPARRRGSSTLLPCVEERPRKRGEAGHRHCMAPDETITFFVFLFDFSQPGPPVRDNLHTHNLSVLNYRRGPHRALRARRANRCRKYANMLDSLRLLPPAFTLSATMERGNGASPCWNVYSRSYRRQEDRMVPAPPDMSMNLAAHAPL